MYNYKLNILRVEVERETSRVRSPSFVSLTRDCSLSYSEVEKLAESLSDGTVYGIISELKDIQHILLASLSKERNTIVKSFEVRGCESEIINLNFLLLHKNMLMLILYCFKIVFFV